MNRTNTSLKPVAVQRITVSSDRVLALSSEERYAYYMLGHFFNELMLLQKLLAFALPKHDDNRPLRQPVNCKRRPTPRHLCPMTLLSVPRV